MSGKRRVAWVLLIGLVSLLAFGASGAVLLALSMAVAEDSVLTGNQITPAEVATASTVMAVTFPPSSQFVGYQSGGFQDQYIKLKVRIPAASLPAFLASPAFAGVTFDSAVRWIDDDRNSVWNGEFTPSRAVKFRSQQIQLPSGQALNVLIEEDNPATVSVYMFWFET